MEETFERIFRKEGFFEWVFFVTWKLFLKGSNREMGS
jgi:hypothetical protein